MNRSACNSNVLFTKWQIDSSLSWIESDENIARIANAVQCHLYRQVTKIVMDSGSQFS